MIIEKRRKKQQIACWILLAVLLYELITALCFLLIPVPDLFLYFFPLSFLYSYLLQFFDPVPVILAFAIVPLLGWIICRMKQYAGKIIIILSQVLLLTANAFITTSHFILGLGVKSSEYLYYTLFFALCPLIFSVLVIMLVNIWKPIYEKNKLRRNQNV